LAGGGETGDPTIASYDGSNRLWNSSDGISYPTNNILRVDFASTVSGVEFDYNPYGINGAAAQGWSLLDSIGGVIASGPFVSSTLAHYDLSAYSGVSAIEWNNGRNDWLSAVTILSYTASVPDSGSTVLLMGAALALFATVKRRNRVA